MLLNRYYNLLVSVAMLLLFVMHSLSQGVVCGAWCVVCGVGRCGVRSGVVCGVWCVVWGGVGCGGMGLGGVE